MTISEISRTSTADCLALVSLAELAPEQGAAVLLPDGTSAALFLLYDGTVCAVENLDPFYGAPVICHGIVGDRAGSPTVASPLGKQVYCLRTGHCLEDPRVSLRVFGVQVNDGLISLTTDGNSPETACRSS